MIPFEFYKDNNIGQALKLIRCSIITPEGKPLSQLDLSFRIGWNNPSTLSRIESGKIIPTRDTLIKICKGLELDDRTTNMLLQKVMYFNNVPILTDEYINEVVTSVKEDFDDFEVPMVLKIATTIIYVNNEFERIFLEGNVKLTKETIVNKDFVEIFFDPIYGIQDRILDWDNFSKELVETLFIVYHRLCDTQNVSMILSNIEKYPEFKKLWNKINKDTINLKRNMFHLSCICNTSFLDNINVHLVESSLPLDNRFLLIQYHYNKV